MRLQVLDCGETNALGEKNKENPCKNHKLKISLVNCFM